MPEKKRDRISRHILQMATAIYEMIGPAVPEEWFSSDITVSQLRVLLLLKVKPLNMSGLAAELGVSLPTASGIMDHLVNKGLVSREADPGDRRVVLCRLSPAGEALTGKLWDFGRIQMEQLLSGLTLAEMEKAAEVAEILQRNVARARERASQEKRAD
jgi:DNA-binding MarR family transcriptional regulator